MKTRKEIELNGTEMDLLLTMAEGNPGAARALGEMMSTTDGFMNVLDLDDMNIRGTQIWVAYKAHCQCNISKLNHCIRERDPDMIETVNKEGLRGNHQWKAVTSGASFMKNRPVLP